MLHCHMINEGLSSLCLALYQEAIHLKQYCIVWISYRAEVVKYRKRIPWETIPWEASVGYKAMQALSDNWHSSVNHHVWDYWIRHLVPATLTLSFFINLILDWKLKCVILWIGVNIKKYFLRLCLKITFFFKSRILFPNWRVAYPVYNRFCFLAVTCFFWKANKANFKGAVSVCSIIMVLPLEADSRNRGFWRTADWRNIG